MLIFGFHAPLQKLLPMPACLSSEEPTTLAGPQSLPYLSFSGPYSRKLSHRRTQFYFLQSQPPGGWLSQFYIFCGRTLISSSLVRWPCLDQPAVTNEADTAMKWAESGAKRQSSISNPKKALFDHPQGSVPPELFTIKANIYWILIMCWALYTIFT